MIRQDQPPAPVRRERGARQRLLLPSHAVTLVRGIAPVTLVLKGIGGQLRLAREPAAVIGRPVHRYAVNEQPSQDFDALAPGRDLGLQTGQKGGRLGPRHFWRPGGRTPKRFGTHLNKLMDLRVVERLAAQVGSNGGLKVSLPILRKSNLPVHQPAACS